MKTGSLVECILDMPLWIAIIGAVENTPVKGNIYTIREVCNNLNGSVGILLEEIVNKPNPRHNNMEPQFGVVMFREVQPPMSVPESLFNQSPEKITV